MVGIHPDRAGAHAHGGLGLDQACGALGHETVVELDGPHVGPGPDEQRIRCVRGPDIAVTGPFHHEADLVVASEVHRGRDVGAAGGQHRVRAGRRGPGIGPAEGLGQGDAAIDVVGIPQVLEQVGAPSAAGVGRAHGEGRVHLHQTPADALTELRPLRWVGPARLPGPDRSDRTAQRRHAPERRNRKPAAAQPPLSVACVFAFPHFRLLSGGFHARRHPARPAESTAQSD